MTRLVRPALLALLATAIAGCAAAQGVDAADLEDALAVELPGFHAVAGPAITAVCDPSPGGGEPPELPPDLGEPVSVFFAQAESTLDAHAWAAEDEDAARSVVDGVVTAADACAHEVFVDSDTDGDGRIDAGGTDVQTAEPWEGAGWTGLRVRRETSGVGAAEQVERRLVRSGDVVLLVVLRSDVLGDDQIESVDLLLERVHDRLG